MTKKRDFLGRRRRLGVSTAEVARRAGVEWHTVERVELEDASVRGPYRRGPQRSTLRAIDAALSEIERERETRCSD